MNPIKIELSGEKIEDMNDLLRQIFWKDPELVEPAHKLLKYIREWSRTENPYTACEWMKYCTRENITQSRYHTILRRLKNTGLAEKTYNKNKKTHEIKLSDEFANKLSDMEQVWRKFRIK